MKHAFFVILSFLGLGILRAQSNPQDMHLLSNGLSISGGIGHLAIKDEYISRQKYSGTLPSFSMSWLRSDSSSGYKLGMDYFNSSTIRNGNISADVLLSALNLDFLYNVGQFTMRDYTAYPYLGPSAGIFLYSRQENIATGGNAFFSAYSFALFLSLDITSTIVVPISTDWSAEVSGKLGLLSIAGRLADLHDDNVKFFKLVTLLSGVRGNTQFLIRYDVTNLLQVHAGYRFDICQSATWNYLLAASDNLIIAITVKM